MLILHYSVSAPGTLSKNHVYCNSQPVPLVSPSMVSRICREVTDPVASRSKSQARRVNCPNRILVSIVSICRRTRHMKRSTPSFYGLSRRRSVSDRSKRIDGVGARESKVSRRRCRGFFVVNFFLSCRGKYQWSKVYGREGRSRARKEPGRGSLECAACNFLC